jgi:RNA polymerase sigma factor (sigma-70 family)
VTLPPFQHLVDAHWRDVARLAHALAGPDHGDDVAQQSWTKALAAYPGLTRADNLRCWLLTITRHCAMDVHRAARRTTPVAEPADLVDAPVHGPPGTPQPELWAVVADLPERQRAAVALKYVTDLEHRDIARLLDTTPAMSRRLVSDALATLRRTLPEPS